MARSLQRLASRDPLVVMAPAFRRQRAFAGLAPTGLLLRAAEALMLPPAEHAAARGVAQGAAVREAGLE